MKSILFYITLVCTAFLLSCSKTDLPDAVDGTPVFSAVLDFGNGNIKSWEAGVDSFYMFTDFEKDDQDVFSFSGKMEQEKCDPNCTETLTIIIRDAKVIPQGLPLIDNSLSRDNYFFVSPNKIDTLSIFDTTYHFVINLIAIPTSTSPSSFVNYEWSEDGINNFSTEPNVNLTFSNLTDQEVTLKVSNFENGDTCISWQTQKIRKSPADRCAVTIKPNFDSAGFFLNFLQAIPFSLHDPFFYEWNIGQWDNEFNFGSFEPFSPYSVTLTDGSDCQSTATYFPSNIVGDSLSNCSANFSYSIEEEIDHIDSTSLPTVTFDSLQLSSVTVIYVDNLGNTYRSDLAGQDANASFKILNVEDYEDNENGFPTKKLELEFNCKLWDGNLNVLPVVDGKAIWGVGYPK